MPRLRTTKSFNTVTTRSPTTAPCSLAELACKASCQHKYPSAMMTHRIPQQTKARALF
ncbi:hypothetical protein T4A_8576 [Trichinella pseudospiralis]|uniref:Uncharacterized protein n=1 Tax=Trichinella pseudospiralis TaxID=6337 RepID=A0A0V1E7Q9_TRIPS|nr:hypothetical protein T4A_8576 [Trichinella pseudospiralis]